MSQQHVFVSDTTKAKMEFIQKTLNTMRNGKHTYKKCIDRIKKEVIANRISEIDPAMKIAHLHFSKEFERRNMTKQQKNTARWISAEWLKGVDTFNRLWPEVEKKAVVPMVKKEIEEAEPKRKVYFCGMLVDAEKMSRKQMVVKKE